MNRTSLLLVLAIPLLWADERAGQVWGQGTESSPGLLHAEFLYTTAPFPSCHASTIVEAAPGRFVAAWFGGTAEGKPDVGIWVSRREDDGWTPPVEVAHGVQADGQRWPCWNPVLFQPKQGPLLLFYKVGPSPSTWWGMLRTSIDQGRSWSDAERLPEGILGPIKNKPLQLADGTLLSGSSSEGLDPPPVWQVHFERSSDGGKHWERVSVPVEPNDPAAIQPSLLQLADGRLQAMGRTRAGKIFFTTSGDQGRSWQRLALTSLPNPNSGTDAVTLRDGRHLLVYNHTPKGRTPLNVAVSIQGTQWQGALVLEADAGEYSYPAVIQASDGRVHITYTWKRQRIKHVVLDPDRLVLQPLPQE